MTTHIAHVAGLVASTDVGAGIGLICAGVGALILGLCRFALDVKTAAYEDHEKSAVALVHPQPRPIRRIPAQRGASE